MMSDFLSAISNSSLFKGLPPAEIEKIETIGVNIQCKKGETVFSEGDDGRGFYIVIQGKVKIYKVSPDGKEQILHIFGRGEPFGEVPVFTGAVFPANAQALENSSLFFFPKDRFVRFISENIPVVLNMLGLLSMRLRRFTMQIEDLSLKNVPGRLAGYLLLLMEEQKQNNRVTLTTSKGQLASLLGTIPETLSRIFSKMSDKGLIDVEGNQIKMIDSAGLRDLADHGKL